MKRRRIRYLVNSGLQLGFTVRFVVIAVLFALFIGFQVYFTIWPVVSDFVPAPVMSLVRHQILVRTAFFLIPAVFVIFAFSIVISHRIAGPLLRIQRTIDRVIQGEDVEPLKLRKKDELKELAGKINDLMELVKKSRQASK
jgi:HAMP domain-containing protein